MFGKLCSLSSSRKCHSLQFSIYIYLTLLWGSKISSSLNFLNKYILFVLLESTNFKNHLEHFILNIWNTFVGLTFNQWKFINRNIYVSINLGIQLNKLLILSGKYISWDSITQVFSNLDTVEILSQIILESGLSFTL